MESIDQQPEEHRSPSRLIWVLATLALVASGVAAFSWSRGTTSTTLPQPVTPEELSSADLEASDRAPLFSVPTLDGGRFTLADHLGADAGKPLLLNLWASWCSPCRAEMPALEAASLRHPGVQFVGVAVQDDMQAAEEFATELGVTYPIGLDERDEVNALYPTFGLPVTYVISDEGTILQVVFGEVDAAKIDGIISTWFGG